MKKLPSGKTAKVNKDTKEMDGLGIAHNNWRHSRRKSNPDARRQSIYYYQPPVDPRNRP
jgi:hypothetical protein